MSWVEIIFAMKFGIGINHTRTRLRTSVLWIGFQINLEKNKKSFLTMEYLGPVALHLSTPAHLQGRIDCYQSQLRAGAQSPSDNQVRE